MREVVIDFETANPDDQLLENAGAWRYAEDKRTDVLCCAFGENAQDLKVWAPNRRHDEALLRQYAADPKTVFVIQGEFEIPIWLNKMVPLGFPLIPYKCEDDEDNRWHDIMAVAATKGLPLALENLGLALHVGVQKDMEGRRITLAMSDPALRSDWAISKVIEYCEKDVETEWAVHKKLGPLSEGEREGYRWQCKMNRGGLRLDSHLIVKAQEVVDKTTGPLEVEFFGLTELMPTQTRALAKLFGFKNANDKLSIDAKTVEAALKTLPANDKRRRPLEIRQELNSAAIKKLPPMQASICADGRSRGLSQFHGTHPGRNAGRLWQWYNFPRGILTGVSPDDAVKAIMTGNPDDVEVDLGAAPIKAVGSSLRHVVVPEEGKVFLAGDYRQIQARLVLALAGQADKLDLIRSGGNLYLDMAKQIYGREIDKDKDPEEYHIGKSAVLGLGFGMGWRKFKLAFAPRHSDEFCEKVVRTYREEWAPQVKFLWYALEHAAVQARGGRLKYTSPLTVRGITFGLTRYHSELWLTIALPSERLLWYFSPSLEAKIISFEERIAHGTLDITKFTGDELEKLRQKLRRLDDVKYRIPKGHKLATLKLNGGLLCENIIMGMEVDIQRRGWANCEEHKPRFPIVMEVYDQLVAEVPERDADEKAFAACMTDMRNEPWVEKLGITDLVQVDCWKGKRYRK